MTIDPLLLQTVKCPKKNLEGAEECYRRLSVPLTGCVDSQVLARSHAICERVCDGYALDCRRQS